jgi:catechol 2,3-dioxygenase-like lactoylglutathione lyase family enzyme
MRITKTTPLFLVDAIEPQLSYWRERLGYAVTAEVAHGDRLGFVILERDGLEIMLQTQASAEADNAAVTREVRRAGVALFHEVDSIDAFHERLRGPDLLAGPRDTFYGMREIYVKDPAGYVHGYAQPLPKTARRK